MRDSVTDTAQLEPETLKAMARARTGLDEFGPPYFEQPLTVLTRAMREEADLNAAGFQAMGERLVNALSNRLRRIALVKAHPEIADEKVDVAALIVGLPRTGSTMLHRLIAASPQVTAVKWWESVFPLPRVGEDGDSGDEQASRIADAEQLVEDIMSQATGFDAIHPLDAHAFDEELPLIEQSFESNMPESMMYVPSYGDWLLAADQREAYLELVEYLRILQWQSPERRRQQWVLKCPHHLTAVRTVLEVFPDAVMVMTHRPIQQLMPSWYSMVATLTGAYSDSDRASAQAEHWTERLRRNLVDMVEARREAPDRFVDVDYRDLLVEPIRQAEQVFHAAGLTGSDADRAAWQAWLDGNKREGRPSHRYTIEQFGIDPGRLERDFRFYTEAFPVAA
jgi:hypothetical protein